jgi:muramoyltetrapeptide carboxypeptidase
MVQPPFLKNGDTVALVAPARKADAGHLEAAREIFHAWGLQVIVAKNISSESHPYLAGSDEERLEDLQSALNDPRVKCIFCARGGYGTTRIIDRLNFGDLSTRPKWIVGFSDITSLHLKLFGLGIKSIHGIMPVLFGSADSKTSLDSLRNTLFNGPGEIHAAASSYSRLGNAQGRIIGGNLSLLVDSLGTASDPDMTDCILVVEEIDEYRYKIDRMLTQLKRAGKLEALSALVVGQMTNIHESEREFSKTVEGLFLDAARDYSYPVVFGFPIGHELPNLAWVHGNLVRLESTASGARLIPLE